MRSGSDDFSLRDHVAVTVLWFAFFTQWIVIPTVILPSQIARIMGEHAPGLTLATGIVVAAGAAVALLVSPLAGTLSDHRRGTRGRRQPFLVAGILASCASLALLAWAATGTSVLVYGLAYLNLQVWWNWAAGPYAGLIPDAVPAASQSRASGWVNVMTVVGIIVGNVLVIQLYTAPNPWPITAAFCAVNLLCLGATLAGVREAPAPGLARPLGARAWLRSFYLDPRTHRTFYLVLITRLISNMGVWSVLTFLLFYLQSVLGLGRDEAPAILAAMLGAGAALSIPASLAGARLADRWGLVRVVRGASWVMAIATMGYVLIALKPSLALVVVAVLTFSVANAAYGAADWYLALRVMPRREHVGRDFGIWHVCMVLPQIVGPVTTGWLIGTVERAASAPVAYELAFGIAAVWFVLAAILVGRVRLPGGP